MRSVVSQPVNSQSDVNSLIAQLHELGWNCLDFHEHLKIENNFFRCELAGRDIFLQNADGQIYAYLNVCPHRQSLLRTTSLGSGPIICPYHAWSFSTQGELKAVPGLKQLFRFSIEDKHRLALTKFTVRLLEPFIFINFRDPSVLVASDAALSEAQFQKLYDHLNSENRT